MVDASTEEVGIDDGSKYDFVSDAFDLRAQEAFRQLIDRRVLGSCQLMAAAGIDLTQSAGFALP